MSQFERSHRGRSTSRDNDTSYNKPSKSKKFDLTKWFKQSTSCGSNLTKHTMLVSDDSDDSTTPFVTERTHSSLSSSSSSSENSTPEMGIELFPNGSRYNVGSPSISTDLNPMLEFEDTRHSISTRAVTGSPSTRRPESNPNSRRNRSSILNNWYDRPVIVSNDIRIDPNIRIDTNSYTNHSTYRTQPSSHTTAQPYPLPTTMPHRTNTTNTNNTSHQPRHFLKPRKKKEKVWRQAHDQKSGKLYYYEINSRETQWHKPLELASESERQAIVEKERTQREFFSSMESNIINCMQRGVVPGSPESGEEDKVKPLTGRRVLVCKKDLVKPSLIKTISSMDVELLAELTGKSGASSSVVSPDSVLTKCDMNTDQQRLGKEYDDSIQLVFSNSSTAPEEELLGLTLTKELTKPSFDRRNTCGTIYVKSTMAAPDKDATIKCVCGVFRAHLLQAATDSHSSTFPKIKFSEYEVFNDSSSERGNSSTSSTPIRTSLVKNMPGGQETVIDEYSSEIEMSPSNEDEKDIIPSLEEITEFYRFVFNKAQMESDCIIVSLIYVERLLRDTNGGVCPNTKNWRSVLFSCMVMASKVWDDLSMWNKDFAHVCPSGIKFPLKRINELELALLTCLKFNVKVLASEYAKYYFLMRSMLIRSGLVGEELMTMKPLDNEGFKRLEFMTSNYKPLPMPKPNKASQRSKSVGDGDCGGDLGVADGEGGLLSWRPLEKQINLEQAVNI